MTDSSPPIDIEAFRATMREAGVEEIVDSTLDIYLTEAPTAFERLEAAVGGDDAEAAAAAAHALKSASSNIWATELVGLLRTIEAEARAGNMQQVGEGLESLRPAFSAVVDYVKAGR